MSSGRRIRHLAGRANLPVEEALERLTRAGIAAASPDNLIARAQVELAEVVLGLRPNAAAPRSAPPAGPERRDPALSGPPSQHDRATPRERIPSRHDYDLALVGSIERGGLRHLDAETVNRIHLTLVEDFFTSGDPIDPPGARENGQLLESAVSRPTTSMGGRAKYPTVPMAASALFCALIQDHPFHNGNKRTALVSMLVFLDLNGYVLTADEEELFDYALALAAHEVTDGVAVADAETVAAAKWILTHSRKLNQSQRTLRWRDLRSLLMDYGCTFENREGNKIAIFRGDYSAHVGARNDGDEIDVNSISHIRRHLRLSESDGYDSHIFFERRTPVSDFINRYRKTLTRLAAY